MMRTLDGLNQRFGKGAVTIAASGTRNDWAMNREKKTPNYTTSWKELPVARANVYTTTFRLQTVSITHGGQRHF
jgi:hypothetical protein